MNFAMTSKLTVSTSAAPPSGPSQGVRTAVSLALFIHLFCVFVALATNNSPSQLSLSFLRITRIYTQLLNFDLTVPYYLTQSRAVDVDHRVEVLPSGANENDSAAWHALPDRGVRGGERRLRYERLGEILDLFVLQEREDQVALMASSVGEHFLNSEQMRPKQIRCRRHLLVPLEASSALGTPEMRDPDAAGMFENVYAASAVVDDETGKVEVVKIDAAGQVARPTESP